MTSKSGKCTKLNQVLISSYRGATTKLWKCYSSWSDPYIECEVITNEDYCKDEQISEQTDELKMEDAGSVFGRNRARNFVLAERQTL